MLNRKARRALKAKGISMDSSKKETIKNEYARLCLAAGELQYKIKMMERDLHELNVKLENLNLEYSELIKQEAPTEAPKAEQPAPTPEAANG